MYDGSPLLLSLLGPLTSKSVEGRPSLLLCSLFFVLVDFATAMLFREIGKKLQKSYSQSLGSLGVGKLLKSSEILSSGDIATLLYLWNPLSIGTCVAPSTSPIENFVVILSIYGASLHKSRSSQLLFCKAPISSSVPYNCFCWTDLVPLAAFGWVMTSHLSLYPIILVIPVILLLDYGSDSPPRKLQKKNLLYNEDKVSSDNEDRDKPIMFAWKPVIHFLLWASIWTFYVLVLCGISVRKYGGLLELFRRTYGFILSVEDLSPNIGLLWYFFAEVFDFFRSFFLIVFHMNILLMILPLAIRLNHRPCFLAFVYIAICSMLKSYPSVGDSALYLGLLGLFVNELADIKFSFFLFCGYIGVTLLSPVMHNLWIWRGTGNANFYFATAMAYACFQIMLVVECIGAMLNHDRLLRKLSSQRP